MDLFQFQASGEEDLEVFLEIQNIMFHFCIELLITVYYTVCKMLLSLENHKIQRMEIEK